ncbi:conserved Plasmodium protein, unknown function [Plasmodium vinckei brucechwatti]|uniref:Uncharacterized protein n=1 Tax=Plasmodium vinckei brucechwatti TaxID=119398 RepID=A0A6V7SKC8_PLAVN|nr:conserved Plasmodium protein, unknown function [Plasmodium vinckei brucechwatti]
MKTNDEETNNHIDNKNGEEDKIFENKFNDINLKLEAYGEGDYRLLRYLPDGTLAFEEVPNEETKNKQHLQQYAQIFCSEMEKYKIQNSNDLNLKNNSEWNKGEEYRILVENELKEIMILFDMILGTLNYDKGTKYLSLNKCNYYRDPEENKQDICISVTNRIEILEKLKKLCESERIQLNSINGIIAQKYYLFFINQLIKHWRILYTKYSEIDYMQIDSNFPYCTEFSVEFFFLPSIFWKISKNPIFLLWPPYPSFSPFKSQYAHITFSIKNLSEENPEGTEEESGENAHTYLKSNSIFENITDEEMNMFHLLDNKSSVSIQFEGISAHLIENNCHIQFYLHPLNVKLKGKNKLKKIVSIDQNNITTIPENIIFKQAKNVHEKLTKAQWVLIDKSIFCILAEQANNLKDKNNEILINLDNVEQNINRNIKIHCTQINHKSIDFFINNISIPSSSKKNIKVDFSFSITYEASGNTNESTYSKTYDSDNNKIMEYSDDEICEDENMEKQETSAEDIIDNELIQIVLNLALSKIRDLFICAWKYFSFEMPYYSSDIHPMVYQDIFPNSHSDTLFTTFFSWFIIALEKYLRIYRK